jgi:hypothetical protein
MQYIKGYSFNTEEEVLAKINEINTHYGIPISPEEGTQNWCWYNEHIDGFYYIIEDDSISQFFGEPIDILIPSINITESI